MKVGDSVTLTVKNPLWPSRHSYGYPIAEFKTYTGTVLPSPSWVGADQLCLSTGMVEFPFRVLDRNRIVGSQESVQTSQNRTFTIDGSKGKSYVVTLENGLWGCNCVGFGFRRSCSHVNMAKAELSGAMVQPKQEKKYGQAKKSACFNIKNDVQSKSKVKRAIVPIHNEAKMTKRSQAIEIMKANTDKDMATVVKLIATKINVTEANAKSYYRYIVANGLAEGVVETTKRTAKTKKVPAAKMLTDLGLNKKGKFTGKVKAEVAKSADEIAKIKEANLERMKQVSAKLSKVRGYLPGQVAAPEADTPADFDPQLAREEVAAMIAEIDRERSSMVARKTAHE